MEERARRDAELVAARVAVPLVAGVEPEQAVVLVAARALDTGRPAQLLQVEAAALLELVGLVRCSCRSAAEVASRGFREADHIMGSIGRAHLSSLLRVSQGKKPRASSLGGCRKPGSYARPVCHRSHRANVVGIDAGRLSSIENASASEGSRSRGRWQIGAIRHVRGGGGLARPPPPLGARPSVGSRARPSRSGLASGRSSGWWWCRWSCSSCCCRQRAAGRSGRGRRGRRDRRRAGRCG